MAAVGRRIDDALTIHVSPCAYTSGVMLWIDHMAFLMRFDRKVLSFYITIP